MNRLWIIPGAIDINRRAKAGKSPHIAVEIDGVEHRCFSARIAGPSIERHDFAAGTSPHVWIETESEIAFDSVDE